MSFVTQSGTIRTWAIIIRKPVCVTLTASINLASQRWCLLRRCYVCYVCSRSRGSVTSVLPKYMTRNLMNKWIAGPKLELGMHQDGCSTLQHSVSGQLHQCDIFMPTQTHFCTDQPHAVIHNTIKSVLLPLFSDMKGPTDECCLVVMH